ncbi:MAG TPA: PIG-L family deacetylase [Candidatus Paceibacterota bacterium]|nr:PIG-L family deacetylase [Verrucomicrobiota bacterium]HRZ47033.1 PIG-L family deacetylase [Candidatus Paceibacterota bacterium]HRZ93240.1 PIG-L family deacetylase [Candidatus Paceibacterota bacterium]
MKRNHIAMAIGAHPDDIEFMMAGTLALLRRAGCETHCLNLASGSCGSAEHTAARLRAIRRREGQAAARVLGAIHHPSLVDDLEIYYERPTLRRLAAVIREVRPTILLVPSPQDYMEDHTNTSRLAVTAAFVRSMRNFATLPRRAPIPGDLTVYHAMPHGLRDPLRRRIRPGAYVNTTAVQDLKRTALSQHRSQMSWLETSQGMNQYLMTMEQFALEVGRGSGRFRFAEGWRRRLHYGFCPPDADPLRDLLGRDCLLDTRYEAALEHPETCGCAERHESATPDQARLRRPAKQDARPAKPSMPRAARPE